jgi:DnaJ-class molecular chaperone
MLSKIELETISTIITNLNFYQILKIPAHASEKEISDAYHREALTLHPDLYQTSEDPEVISLSKKIFSKVVEAYRTLSSKERRIQYDQQIKLPSDKSEEEITAVTQKAKSPAASAGIRFFKLAQAAFQSGDLNSAKMNVQIALNADPKNPEFLALLHRIDIKSGK